MEFDSGSPENEGMYIRMCIIRDILYVCHAGVGNLTHGGPACVQDIQFCWIYNFCVIDAVYYGQILNNIDISVLYIIHIVYESSCKFYI